MTEFQEAVRLANKILEEANIDPDASQCMLARQFLRQVKRDLESHLDPTGDMINSNRDEILKKHILFCSAVTQS